MSKPLTLADARKAAVARAFVAAFKVRAYHGMMNSRHPSKVTPADFVRARMEHRSAMADATWLSCEGRRDE